MKIINPTYSIVDKLIVADYKAPIYTPSKYNIVEKTNEGYIVFNTLSRAIILIDECEYSILKDPNSTIFNDAYNLFVGMHFLVPKTLDEEKRYFEIYNFYKLLNDSNKKIKTFKIYTTTHCNARCFYCFEEGIPKENMTEETTKAVIKYIYKNKINGKIKLYWFGGEPLCNQKVINQICKQLKEDRVDFESTIITNGYLFDGKLIEKAVNEWNLTFAQVTLDGYRDEHNKRKAYINPKDDPFYKTIENIRLLNLKGVKLIVRLNFDKDNINSIKQLISYLEIKFKGLNNITFTPVLLIDDCFRHQTTDKANNKLLMSNYLFELYETLYKKNMLYFAPVYTGLKKNRCMADNDSSAIISTDGRLFTCQNCDDNMCYGNIYDDVINQELLDSWRKPKNIRPKCKNCAFLPECTPFDKCPVESESCVLSNNYRIRKKMIASLEKYEKEKNHEK